MDSFMASGDASTDVSVSEYLRELKLNISTWEDIVLKSQKLNFNLKNVGQSVANVIDSIGLVCGTGRNNVSGIDRVTQLLSEITVLERYVTDKVCVLNKAVQDNLVVNLSQQIETWRRSITTIKRDRDVDGRKAKSEYKKSLSEVMKLEKKIHKRSGRKQSLSDTMSLQVDYANQDLQNKERLVEELERCVLRKAICEERSRYRHFVECLRPVLAAQLSMRDDFDRLQRIYDELYSEPLCDLSVVSTEVESYVRQYNMSERSRANSFCSDYSRANSQLSLASSNRSSSVDEDHHVSHATSLPPYCPDNLDTSSSTLHDPNNESLQIQTKDHIDQSYSDDTDDYQRPISTDTETICPETTLYPNQALPPPRYSNLRQLKQNAERKYGMSTLSRDLPSLHVPRDTLPLYTDHAVDTEPSHYTDCTFARVLPKHSYRNGSLSHSIAPSHYSDCTLTRNSLQLRDPGTANYKGENDIYSSISQIYGTTSLFAEVTSGTSTFKRRKPSNITAMDAPVITDKRFFQPHLSDDPRLRWDNTQRKNGAVFSDRDQTNVRHSVDLSNLTGYCYEKTNRQNTVNGNVASDPTIARKPSPLKNTVYRDSNLNGYTAESSFHGSVTGNSNGDSSIFKQQLLSVIQTGPTPFYRNAVSSVSSHMF